MNLKKINLKSRLIWNSFYKKGTSTISADNIPSTISSSEALEGRVKKSTNSEIESRKKEKVKYVFVLLFN